MPRGHVYTELGQPSLDHDGFIGTTERGPSRGRMRGSLRGNLGRGWGWGGKNFFANIVP